jgi:D-psicose/D-tagatose/L-ribulose 3-epimerase
MKLGLINSAFAQAGQGTRFGLEATKRLGFDTVDIFTDPLDIDAAERRLIRETCRELDLPIVSLCCVALGLIDFNPSVRRFHLERCRAFLDLAAELGCSNLLLVLGEYVWQREVIPAAEQHALAVEAVGDLGRQAAERGLKIAIELEPFRLSLVNSIDTMLAFLDQVGQPDIVRANCDISHLHLVGTPPAEVARLAGRIEHVHLSDCDGKVHGDLPPGRGVTPIADYLAAIRDTGYDGVVSIELEYSPEPERIVEWVAEAKAATAAIMDSLGCRASPAAATPAESHSPPEVCGRSSPEPGRRR